jgi:hypothetical protein
MRKNETTGRRPGYLLLLPRGFRWVGVGMLLVMIAIVVCGREKALPFSKPVIQYILQALSIVGMLFLSSARRKIEDERSIYLRFQAISHALLFFTPMFLITPLLGQDTYKSGFAVLFGSLFLYWFMTEMSLRFNGHEKHD